MPAAGVMISSALPTRYDINTAGMRAAIVRVRAMEPWRAVIALIAFSTVLHVVAAAALGLGTDEAYTIGNARILSWSYVDYPPLHAWLVGFVALLTHSESALVLRLPFVLLFAGSTWLMYSLTALLFSPRAGFWACLCFNLAPVYAIAHGVLILPDGPLTFLLLAGALVTARQLFAQDSPSRTLSGWLGAGVLAGLAMLTKYHGAFLVVGALAFLLTWRPGRAILLSPGPWISACVALLIFAPVVVWNAGHDWIGLFFQTGRFTKMHGVSPARLLGDMAGQVVYLSPCLFVPLCYALWRALATGPRVREMWLLGLLAIGPILVFTCTALFTKALPHWPMPGWLFAFPLLGKEVTEWERRFPLRVTRFFIATAAIMLCAFTSFVSEDVSGWMVRGLPVRVAELDPTLDLLEWREVRTALYERHLMDRATPAVAGTRWMDAGKLNYEIGREIPVLCLCGEPHQFRYLHNPSQFEGRNIIVMQTQLDLRLHGPRFARWFERVESLPPIEVRRGGHDAVGLAVFRGIRLKSPETAEPSASR